MKMRAGIEKKAKVFHIIFETFTNQFITTLRKNLTLMACYQHCRYVLCVSHQTFLLTIQMYRTKENDLT